MLWRGGIATVGQKSHNLGEGDGAGLALQGSNGARSQDKFP